MELLGIAIVIAGFIFKPSDPKTDNPQAVKF